MSGWVANDEGTFYRQVAHSRKRRRCDECRRLLDVGEPYVEHRAAPWAEFAQGHAYSIATCGIKTSDCPGPRP